MKNLVIICIALVSFGAFAQNQKHHSERRNEARQHMKDLTPEQRADLKTKKMTLRLDLTATQQAELKKLETENAKTMQARFQNKKDRKEMTSTEMFEAKSAMMDAKIEMKRKMKSILTKEQYQKWEKGMHHKSKRMRHHFRK